MTGMVFGGTTRFEDDGPLNRKQFIHRVQVDDMEPDTIYCEKIVLVAIFAIC